MADRNNAECFWDEFCDWAADEGVGDPRATAHPDDWLPWFRCWCNALDAADQAKEARDV
jgi:hypothetical protein